MVRRERERAEIVQVSNDQPLALKLVETVP